MKKLTKERIDEIKIILAKLVSGEIKNAWVIIDEGTIIDFPSSTKAVNDYVMVIQLSTTGRIIEEILSLQGRKVGPIVISNDDEVRGGLDTVIQRIGACCIVIESKGVIEGDPLHYADGDAGGTKKRIALAVDEIAKMFYLDSAVLDLPDYTKSTAGPFEQP